MTRQDASGTRSCSRPSRRGLASTRGAVNVIVCLRGSGLYRSVILRPVMWQYTPRVAVIRGLRTPFAKSGTHYAQLSALDLGKLVVAELVQRSGVDPASVQELVFGNVIPSVKAPNIAREIILGTGLPRSIPGYTVSKACASSNQAITSAADLIFRGYADTVIAGGAESLSDVPILFSKKFATALVSASKQKSVGKKLGSFSGVKLGDLA